VRIVLDGPMGTEITRRGGPTPAPAWSAAALDAAPDVVAAVHRDYVVAGATVHTANTFRTTRRAAGPRWRELLRRAVAIARGVVPASQRVAGSIAPLEDCYRPELSPGAAGRPEHAATAQALAAEGVDLILCETFPSGAEAIVAVQEAARTGLPVWAALTAGPDASLMTPAAMRASARDCVAAGASAVLVSCTPAMRTLAYVEALAGLGAATGAYANAGDPADGLGWDAEPAAAARRYAVLAGAWLSAGAEIVGGCCGTRPEHIAELARLAR
jgi:S-methylmethionine-dependent homocysteine/selenocysteine methylase